MSEDLDARIFRTEAPEEDKALVRRGVKLYQEGNFQKAIEPLRAFIGVASRTDASLEAAAHHHLALCYGNLGYPQQGLREIDMALACFRRGHYDRELYVSERFLFFAEYPVLFLDEVDQETVDTLYEGMEMVKNGQPEDGVSQLTSLAVTLPATAMHTHTMVRNMAYAGYEYHLGRPVHALNQLEAGIAFFDDLEHPACEYLINKRKTFLEKHPELISEDL